MHPLRLLLSLLVVSTSSVLAQSPAPVKWPPPKPTKHDYTKWEKAVAAFEQEDKEQAPPKHPILFVGSSTIVRWKSLAQDFPDFTVLNRGFGGNQIKDTTFYAERMIFPYEPSAIVLRAGGNDINAGWPVEDVFNDYKAFVAKVRGKFPGIPIYYIGLSPTIKRWEQVAAGNQLNDLIADYCKKNDGLTYIDTREISLGADGKPVPELFVADGLHFSEAGYKLLTAKVLPVLSKVKALGK